MKTEIQILKLSSGEEIIGYTIPEMNTAVKYNILVDTTTHPGVFERSSPRRGVTVAFTCVVGKGGFISKRWLMGEVLWSTLLEKKEIPYVFIPDKLIICKVVGNRISEHVIEHYERYIEGLRVRSLLNEHFDDNPFSEGKDSGNFDAASQAVS